MPTRFGDIGRGAQPSPAPLLVALRAALVDARRTRFTGVLVVDWTAGTVTAEGVGAYTDPPALLWTEAQATVLAAVRALPPCGRVVVRVTAGRPAPP